MLRVVFALELLLLLVPAAAIAQPNGVEQDADAILKKMGQTLSAAKVFSFEAHAMNDQIMPDGQKVQFARNTKVTVRRPDRISADLVGDVEDLSFRYDGKHVVLFNHKANAWGQTDTPTHTIDETMDMLADKYGMTIPLADLLLGDPYASLTERVRSGRNLGISYVFDVKCHHLAFRQEGIDWQIWVEDGAQPVPRKVVITYKDSPGYPNYTAFLSKWNLKADAPDSSFTFTPPAGAKQIDFANPTNAATTQPTAPAAAPAAAEPRR
jgi:hypothetical protein